MGGIQQNEIQQQESFGSRFAITPVLEIHIAFETILRDEDSFPHFLEEFQICIH